MTSPATIFTIPAGVPSAQALARTILEDYQDKPEALYKLRIFLPTRRAGRVLTDHLIALSNPRPLILPHIIAIGDISEEELFAALSSAGAAHLTESLPPAIAPARRQALLAALVRAGNASYSHEQALQLGQALGQWIDEVATENLNCDNLALLVPQEFALHWQITTEFLQIVTKRWPEILAEEGVMDAAVRRDRLIRALADFWENAPPNFPVLAAGSTGSVPAAAALLKTIARLPQGAVILPGLDAAMEDADWESIRETHPQWTMKRLLESIGVDRRMVRPWPCLSPCRDHDVSQARRIFAREFMQSPQAASSWTRLAADRDKRGTIEAALNGLSVLSFGSDDEQAKGLALLLREALEDECKTAILVTPDRALARRVQAVCQRWGFLLDDSGGLSLSDTSAAIFMKLIVKACIEDFSPVALLALLKHPLCRPACEGENWESTVQSFDARLRGLKPRPGLEGIFEKTGTDFTFVKDFQALAQAFCNTARTSLSHKIGTHIALANFLSGGAFAPEQTDEEDTAGSAGAAEKAVRGVLETLAAQSGAFSALDIKDYLDTIDHFMAGLTMRPPYGFSPRLQILGQLEARMVSADLIILAGLNEGTWPHEPPADPWMSRPMRAQFGLPAPERRIGRSAHDFVQGFCAPQVIVTRAQQKDGAPTIPSRWLQRMEAVLQSAGLTGRLPTYHGIMDIARDLDRAEIFAPAIRPAPAPPAARRPQTLSVTQVEKLLRDPYSIYARHILNLKPREDLERPVEEKDKGTYLHEALRCFIIDYPDALPPMAIAEDRLFEAVRRHYPDALDAFESERLRQTCRSFVLHEAAWRKKTARRIAAEIDVKAGFDIGGRIFTLTGRIDRIDQTTDGLVVIDYKSGGQYPVKTILAGNLPQLPLAALAAAHSKNPNMPRVPVTDLAYWIVKPDMEFVTVSGRVENLLEKTAENLIHLMALFYDDSTPYYSLPDPAHQPRYNDYTHLSRVAEWGTAAQEADAP